jgi:hypothetical protein
VTLDGSSSSDSDNDPLSYHWSQTFGPEVEIDDANAAITTFSPAEYGAYIFELVVNDGSLDSFPDTVNIVIGSGHIPVADAGLPKYAGTDPVQLDGTGSYDPDNSGPLSYQWRQISGPTVTITKADTSKPTISGFTLTDSIQRCEFELIVSDGQYESLPGTVFVIIVHNRYSESSFRLESGTFDPERPTFIDFGRGGSWDGGSEWNSRANILSECCDSFDIPSLGDYLIVYLSRVAPNYKQPIQLVGCSGGSIPAIEVPGYMNSTFQDRRYAVNHVTNFDGSATMSTISRFLASRVDREQCWVDNYPDAAQNFLPCLTVKLPAAFGHCGGLTWYKNSLTYSDLNQFTSPVAGPGVIGGGYWSVVGPGKNLQLALIPYMETYRFKWYGSTTSGYMDFYDESLFPGRLPEPVTLVIRSDGTDPNGLVLTCDESENAVGYQLLFGPDPYRVAHYDIVSDTPYPPTDTTTTLPFEKTYWTVKARDQYGSTIYADPMCIDAFILSKPVENLSTGKRYGYIQHAIDDANSGDKIVAGPGAYHETIDFGGKNLTLRSVNPQDPAVVAATVIDGGRRGPVVTFESGERFSCMLRGFTIEGAAVSKDNADGDTPPPDDMGTGGGAIACFDLFRTGPVISDCVVTGSDCAGLYCYRSGPTVINCTFAGNDSNGVELQGRSLAKFINCAIVGNYGYGVSGGYPTVTNCTIVGNELSAIASYTPNARNCILWDNASGEEQGQQIIDFDGSGSVTYSNVQGGWPGEGNIDADPCFVQLGTWEPPAVSPEAAWNPNPSDGAWNVDPNVVLSWSAGQSAVSHDVYFGTAFDDVNDAGTDSTVYMGNQDSNTWDIANYDPCGLAPGTIYFWRIDEINDSHGHTFEGTKGTVWSLSTENPNLVGWWRFDEGDGLTAMDSSPYDHNGILSGLVSWTKGLGDGHALEFNGGKVVVEDSNELRPMYQVTVSAWVHASVFSDSTVRIVVKGVDNRETFDLEVGDHPDVFGFIVREEGPEDTLPKYTVEGGNMRLDEWIHVAGTYDGSSVVIYSNGQVRDSWPIGPIVLSQDIGDLGIGNAADVPRAFDGIIDDVRVYDRGFTPVEILQLYKASSEDERRTNYGGDYHPRPDSPCIDAGDNSAVPADIADLDNDGNTVEPTPWDKDGRDRFADGDCNGTGIVDMGVYEFSYSYIGDFDDECDLDWDDFAVFALAWLTGPQDLAWNPDCDISVPADNRIDWYDLGVFGYNWLAE